MRVRHIASVQTLANVGFRQEDISECEIGWGVPASATNSKLVYVRQARRNHLKWHFTLFASYSLSHKPTAKGTKRCPKTSCCGAGRCRHDTERFIGRFTQTPTVLSAVLRRPSVGIQSSVTNAVLHASGFSPLCGMLFLLVTGLGTPFRVISPIFTIINTTWIANLEVSFQR